MNVAAPAISKVALMVLPVRSPRIAPLSAPWVVTRRLVLGWLVKSNVATPPGAGAASENDRVLCEGVRLPTFQLEASASAGADDSTTVAMAVAPTRTRRGRRDLRMARTSLGPRMLDSGRGYLGPSATPPSILHVGE